MKWLDSELSDQIDKGQNCQIKLTSKGEPRRGWTSWAGTASDWPEDTDWGEGIFGIYGI